MKKKTIYGSYCGCVYGQHGELFDGTLSREEMFCKMFPLEKAEKLTHKMMVKYMSTQPLPRWAKAIYADNKALDVAMEAMQYYVQRQLSLVCLRYTQVYVHMWLETMDIPTEVRRELECNYVPQNATELQIARYLADVLIYAVRHS